MSKQLPGLIMTGKCVLVMFCLLYMFVAVPSLIMCPCLSLYVSVCVYYILKRSEYVECDSWMIDQPQFLLAFQYVQPPNTHTTSRPSILSGFSLHTCWDFGISLNLIFKLVVHVNASECVA